MSDLSVPTAAEEAEPAGRATLLSTVFAGIIAGVFVISFTLSLAALVFSGDLATYLPAGIGVFLVSSFVLGAVISLGSALRPVTAAAQDNTGVILALVAADIQRRATPGTDVLPTLVAAIAATSIITGVVFYLLGRFRLGKIIRFMPYPVVGGFLAGTGWLLVQGSLAMLTGRPIGLHDLGALATPELLVRWVPGVGFGLLLTALLRRFKHPLLLPAVLAGAFATFFLAIGVTRIGLAGAASRGLLLGPFPQGGMWPPLGPSGLGRVDFGFLSHDAGNIAAAVLLAVIAALLNASGYELATDQDVDQDKELRSHGLANVLVGLAGGAPGYMMLGGSMLTFRTGARGRLPGLIAAGTCLVPLFAGTAVLGYFPKAVLGGLLFFLGLSFIVENVVESFAKLPRGEYALVILILAVVVTAGFLQGVGLGIVVSSFLFALNYAHVDVVKHAISGSQLRSKASRSIADETILRAEGSRIEVIQLQGYLFFGTAHGLLQRVKERLAAPGQCRFVVLDFRHVHGLDASAVVAFVRMKKLAESHKITLVLTDVPERVKTQLERSECLDAGADAAVAFFVDLDHGLEWCEHELIARSATAPASALGGAAALVRTLKEPDLVERLLSYFETVEARAGYDLFRAGDAGSDVFLVESGEVEAWLELGDGRAKRLRTMGPGTVVGESALYLGGRRSASVRATTASVLRRLSPAALERMTTEAPELSSALHRFIATVLADRMVTTTSATQMLFH